MDYFKTPEFKAHLVSAAQTFLVTFLIVAGTTLQNGAIEWSASFWGSVAMAAGRAAIKAVWEAWMPHTLGGKKKSV